MTLSTLEVTRSQKCACKTEMDPNASPRIGHRRTIPQPQLIQADRHREIGESTVIEAHPREARGDVYGKTKEAQEAHSPGAAVAMPARAQPAQSALDALDVVAKTTRFDSAQGHRGQRSVALN